MNKLSVIKELIKLSKSSDYALSTDWSSWKKYYTKDVAMCYEMNPVEMLLIKNLFS